MASGDMTRKARNAVLETATAAGPRDRMFFEAAAHVYNIDGDTEEFLDTLSHGPRALERRA